MPQPTRQELEVHRTTPAGDQLQNSTDHLVSSVLTSLNGESIQTTGSLENSAIRLASGTVAPRRRLVGELRSPFLDRLSSRKEGLGWCNQRCAGAGCISPTDWW